MSAPRGLTEEEAAAWERLAASVTPLESRRPVRAKPVREPSHPVPQPSRPVMPQREPHFRELLDRGVGANRGHARKPDPVPLPDRRPEPLPKHGLDSHWDRKLKSGQAEPDFSLDLHGHSLDAAYNRLESGLFQAKAMGARLVLVVTGKPRPVDAADRGSRRGAIRAKILDWLAAGPHGADIAAIRKAHRRHGGEGALYLVLKRNR